MPRGYGVDYNETAYPFYPAPPRLPWAIASPGTSASPWDRPRRRSCSAGRRPRTRRSASRGLAPMVRPDGAAPFPPPTGAHQASHSVPAGSGVGLSLQVARGIDLPHRVIVTVDGHRTNSAGRSPRLLRPGAGGWPASPGVRGFHLPATLQAHHCAHRGRASDPGAVCSLSSTKSEEIRVRAPTASVVIRSVAWDAGWKGTVSVNGGPARECHRPGSRPGSGDPDPGGRRRGDVPLPTTASVGRRTPQHRRGAGAPGASRRLAGRATSSPQRSERCVRWWRRCRCAAPRRSGSDGGGGRGRCTRGRETRGPGAGARTRDQLSFRPL